MFTPVKTQDGSSTFYSETFGEWFHSRDGAYNEAQKTYVETAQLDLRVRNVIEAVQAKDGNGRDRPTAKLKILDVCYGLGYNTAAALETIFRVSAQSNVPCPVEIRALEMDIEVARSAIAQKLTHRYSTAVQQILEKLATDRSLQQNTLCAQILLGDARQQIQPLVAQPWQADIIFLDPFSPPHCPQLWTVEFLQLVAQCLNPHGGEIVTYSCAAAVRSALMLAGLSIGSTQTGGRKWPGTIAYYEAAQSCALPTLSPQEIEHLQTKAAVPYRDPTLQATSEAILAQRAQEQAVSELAPTGPWRRRWQAISTASSS